MIFFFSKQLCYGRIMFHFAKRKSERPCRYVHSGYRCTGIDREELVVYGDDNALLVGTSEERDFTYGRKGFHCHVSLPSDADTELAIAELKSGVLHFYVPKAKQFSKHPCTRIIVY